MTFKIDREMSITIKLIPREDGGLRVCSDDVPGLILSHSDPELVMADLGPAIADLLMRNVISRKG